MDGRSFGLGSIKTLQLDYVGTWADNECSVSSTPKARPINKLRGAEYPGHFTRFSEYEERWWSMTTSLAVHRA